MILETFSEKQSLSSKHIEFKALAAKVLYFSLIYHRVTKVREIRKRVETTKVRLTYHACMFIDPTGLQESNSKTDADWKF